MPKIPGQSALRLIILLLLSTLLLSCGSIENPIREGNGAGISFRLKWPVAKSVGSVPPEIPPGVVTIRMSVSGPGMSTIIKDFAASARTGSITSVPVGSNRTITFQGLASSSDLIYQYVVTNVTLVSGQPYDCGTVTMNAVVNPSAPVIPTAPSGLSATAVSTSQINLAWVDYAINETGYKIERKTGADGIYVLIATVAANDIIYNDTALSASTTYYYRVRATNNIGDSGDSNEVNATTSVVAPAPTYSISGTITSGGAALAGVTVTLTGSGTTTATTDSAGNYSFSGALNGSYTLTPDMAGYTFDPATLQVTVNGANLSAMNFAATAVTTVPATPSGLSATTVSSNQINLAWVDNANNETGYKIERKAGPGGTYTQIGTAAANATIYKDTGLSASTAYYYRVLATNGIGDSEYTAEASVITLDPATYPDLLKVTGGTYLMGDSTFSDAPLHQVSVGDFYIGSHEVTQGEWLAVMGTNPSSFTACGLDCPVENVSWDDIRNFIATLNQRSSKSYRLPTEAEWEFAARSGGMAETYSGGSNVDAVAWYSGNSGVTTHPVGLKQGNGLGIYDMSGNVWEWVSDFYSSTYYSSSPQANPTGPASGSTRVIRGGSWKAAAAGKDSERTSIRGFAAPAFKTNYFGFRLAASVE